MHGLGPLLSRQLHYVCGKGGVGKSVVSCALARHFQRHGLRVLLVQVNAPDSHARLLGTDPIDHELREERSDASGGTLHVVNVTPAAAMKEYALMTLKFEAVYRTVFENRLTRAFLRFIPSMTELTIQGKIWFHAEESLDDGSRRFDRIVVDCPSTGHGLRFLKVARIITDASRVGPMAEKTRLMAGVIEDPARTAVHVVALPEELPVNEARDLVTDIRRTKTAPLGAAFLNQRLQRLFDAGAEAALAHVHRAAPEPVTDEALRQLLEVADRRRQREGLEREQRDRLDGLELPVVELPLLLVAPLGPAELNRFADVVDRAAGGR